MPIVSASPASRSARCPMRPAHSSGAASRSANPSGSGRQKRSSATVSSAKPPSMSSPVKRAPSQRFSRPERQKEQVPSVQPSQGTPTRRPSSSLVATIWWPRISGYRGAGTSPSTMWRSVRHTPQARTRSRTCPGPGLGSATSASRSPRPGASSSIALMAQLWHAGAAGSLGRLGDPEAPRLQRAGPRRPSPVIRRCRVGACPWSRQTQSRRGATRSAPAWRAPARRARGAVAVPVRPASR